MFIWWYGQGWRRVYREAADRVVRVAHLFSVPILVRTLWSPWRRIVTLPGASFDAKLRAFGDNMVSRTIGFTVRILVLFTAAIILLFTGLAGILYVLAWPLVPIAIPLLVVRGLLV